MIGLSKIIIAFLQLFNEKIKISLDPILCSSLRCSADHSSQVVGLIQLKGTIHFKFFLENNSEYFLGIFTEQVMQYLNFKQSDVAGVGGEV